MRFVAPAREQVDPVVFSRPPLSDWSEFGGWLSGSRWPTIDDMNARRGASCEFRFVAQTRELEAENLHYEMRIAERGEISTRENNWHDLLNAMIWLRYAPLKTALNRRQIAEIDIAGMKTRTR